MSRPPRLTWTIPLLLACLASGARADAPAEVPVTGDPVPALAGFDRLMVSFVRDRGAPGAALAIARHGRIVYARGFGYADVEKREPVDPDALFRIASVSKPVTAAAVLQLAERGKLKLDDPAFDLLPAGLTPILEGDAKPDPRLRQITVRHLLHHTGGFDRDASFDPMFRSVAIARAAGAEPPATPGQVVRYMMGRRLDFDPGTREAYSNFGYCVLGRVIERAAGTGYEDYVRREVLAPLGIRRMRLGRTLLADRAPGEVRYYPRRDRAVPSVFPAAAAGPDGDAGAGKTVPVAYGGWCLESMDAHGGWLASAPELARFASAFDDPNRCPVLKAESVLEMFRRPKDTGYDPAGKPKAAYYADGWMVRPVGKGGEEGGRMNTWHAGRLDGTSTLLVRRHDGLAWAVLFNGDADEQGKAYAEMIDPLLHPVAEGWPEGREFQDLPAD